MNRWTRASCAWALLLACSAACDGQQVTPGIVGSRQALQGLQDDVVGLCGFACYERGIDVGSAIVSGVAPPDAFFATLVAYGRRSDALAAAIDDELRAIAADFDVGDDVGPEIAMLAEMVVKGPVRARAARPECSTDTEALLDAQARCDTKLTRETAVLQCAGVCEVDLASPSCPDGADLRCSLPSAGKCSGDCSGTCSSPIRAAVCDGECRGACDGACSALSADGQCQGLCDGKCTGRCALPHWSPEPCDGECQGTCSSESTAGACRDALQVACVVPLTGESVACKGRCLGQTLLPKGLPECMTSAKVDAILDLHCEVAGVSIEAVPLAAPEDPLLQARFLTALRGLSRRLPALLALAAQGERIIDASEDLKAAGRGSELPDSFEAQSSGDIHARFAQGLQCASDQLQGVEMLVDTASSGSSPLNVALDRVDDLRGALGLESP